MPRKIRQLKSDLRRAGFVELKDRGKGDHSKWQHPDVPAAIVGLDGQDGDDAKQALRLMRALVEQTLAERTAKGQQ
ncbi:MAG: type II toxin-antitoxin system HicA family toxin [Thermomicrobiales bacterium]